MDSGSDPASVAVVFAVILGITALACERPEQWGLRRLAMGACAGMSAIAAILLSPSLWWWGGLLWGLHQMYLGWSFVSRRRRSTHERVEYLQASVSVLAYIALADGEIKPRESTIIREAYARGGFSAEDLREVGRIVGECERRFFADGSDPDRLFKLLQSACAVVLQHSNERTRITFFRTAVLISASDGFVSSGEDRALKAAEGWLGISDTDAERAWRGVGDHEPDDGEAGASAQESAQDDSEEEAYEEPVVPPDLATYYASILGISVTASPQEVKRAYREKAKHYHPDVVAHKGPIFAREAEERFKEVSRAYGFFRGTTVAT